MSDLPSLDAIKMEIQEMRRGSKGGYQRPHKLVMLLSVIELVDRGLLTENKIYLEEPLITVFENYFNLVRKKDDWCQPGPPFFHLRSSGFWFHKIKPGREKDYAALSTTGGGVRLVQENIDYAYLREDVFRAIQGAEARYELRILITSLLNPDFDGDRPEIQF
ncbi:MAG: hypothetical protein KBH93_00630 [Anaerolineae bacterium]|nr:hypothetical protein [Anaerolineae bacterium]